MTIRLGDVTIDRVIEIPRSTLPTTDMLPESRKEIIERHYSWLKPHFFDESVGDLGSRIQSYVVRTPRHTVIIDTGVGNDKPREENALWHRRQGTYLDDLVACGVTPEQVDFVLCTHLHIDHVGWNTRLQDGRWVPTFPNARYVFGKTEFDYWTEQHAKASVPTFVDSVLPVVEAGRSELVGNDHELGDHVRVLPTPGHTPGHVAFAFGRGKDAAVVSGDLMHSPLQARYPELSFKPDVDQAQAATTRRNFMERYCDTDTLCCIAHFPSPSVGKIRRS